ncbi:histidinol-phosphate aminotransferase [Amaricoccus macauensis]|uniref:Histidinol-phosphate aminotransferase n=1 Tax=Amaricoccus macauensis TaxID=57001 RepID=A0A840SKD7_9RHOB|nr:pyridoxal phosphate-dependent aminotransferase [Amaricoccus macauensis]MBB5221434.1 histidinol-phosphate aminotransferase [Amaricoccus macauensis]
MRLTPLAASLPATVPFVGPEAQERALRRPFVARIGANESVFGPSPKAIAAMAAAASEVWMYADPELHDLKAALAAHHGVRPQNITVGEGIDGILGNLVRLLVGPGTPVVTSAGAYPTFNYHVAGFGGVLQTVPYRRDQEDPEALLLATRKAGAPLVYLANPDNPMGTWHSGRAISEMIGRLPGGAVLCLDEAYADFAPDDAIPPLDPAEPRVIRMRTFSKAHGMAGARIGYAIGHPELIAAFDRVRNHFGMNRMSVAGAIAALGDHAWLGHVREEVAAAKARIAEIAAANGLRTLLSATNFVAVDCGGDGRFATAVLDGLVRRGVFVRKPGVAPLDRCIRVSAGRPPDLDAFAAALPEALADANKSHS